MDKRFRNYLILSSILIFIAVGIAVFSMVLSFRTYGDVPVGSFFYIGGALLALVLFVWSIRVPLHRYAAMSVAFLGMAVSCVSFAQANYLNNKVAFWLNVVSAFFSFVSIAMAIHTGVAKQKYIKPMAIISFSLAAAFYLSLGIFLLVRASGISDDTIRNVEIISATSMLLSTIFPILSIRVVLEK